MITEYIDTHGALQIGSKPRRKNKKVSKQFCPGTQVRCEAPGFKMWFRGTVRKNMENSSVIQIENTFACDRVTAINKNYMAVVKFQNMEEV